GDLDLDQTVPGVMGVRARAAAGALGGAQIARGVVIEGQRRAVGLTPGDLVGVVVVAFLGDVARVDVVGVAGFVGVPLGPVAQEVQRPALAAGRVGREGAGGEVPGAAFGFVDMTVLDAGTHPVIVSALFLFG